MKKFLPKTKYSPKGFTLVELLVVITIIAILAVVGITAFSGAQKTARDGRRRADIDSIAQAMESKYDPTTGTYQALADGYFASNKKPADPDPAQSYDTSLVTLSGGTANAGFWTCATLENGPSYNGNASAKGSGTAYPTYSVASTNQYYCKSSQQSQ